MRMPASRISRRRPATAVFSHPRCEPLESRRLLSAGDLDPSFAGDGTVTMDMPGAGALSDAANAVAVQNDGKLVVAASSGGHMTVLRYLADGSLDPSFGVGGTVRLAFGRKTEVLHDVAVDGLGRIVLAGALADDVALNGGDFAVLRLLPNGTRDASFDGDGLALVDFGGSDGAVGRCRR